MLGWFEQNAFLVLQEVYKELAEELSIFLFETLCPRAFLAYRIWECFHYLPLLLLIGHRVGKIQLQFAYFAYFGTFFLVGQSVDQRVLEQVAETGAVVRVEVPQVHVHGIALDDLKLVHLVLQEIKHGPHW